MGIVCSAGVSAGMVLFAIKSLQQVRVCLHSDLTNNALFSTILHNAYNVSYTVGKHPVEETAGLTSDGHYERVIQNFPIPK